MYTCKVGILIATDPNYLEHQLLLTELKRAFFFTALNMRRTVGLQEQGWETLIYTSVSQSWYCKSTTLHTSVLPWPQHRHSKSLKELLSCVRNKGEQH